MTGLLQIEKLLKTLAVPFRSLFVFLHFVFRCMPAVGGVHGIVCGVVPTIFHKKNVFWVRYSSETDRTYCPLYKLGHDVLGDAKGPVSP